MIPRFKPAISSKEIRASLFPQSNSVESFEKEFAKKFEAQSAVSFSYGRSGLWAFLQAVGLENDEVIMPAYTCSVVAHAVMLSNNKPVFVDISLDDYNMDLDELREAINSKTRAIIATHLFGYPLDLDKLQEIVKEKEKAYRHKIWLIQDCAHSFGAKWKGKLVNTVGDVALFGLNISKTMTSIFGGMLTFQENGLAEVVRGWRDENFSSSGSYRAVLRRLYLAAACFAFNEKIYGLTWWLQENTSVLNKLTKSYHLDDKIHFPPDFKTVMNSIEASVGLEQLKKYDDIIRKRQEMAEWYDANLRERDDFVLPPLIEGATYSHYVVRVPDRRLVVKEFAEKGVHLGELIQYNIPDLPSYCVSAFDKRFKNSRLASKTTINFPLTHKIKKNRNILFSL